MKVSVVIPSRNEKFLVPTVKNLLEKNNDIEVIVVLEGYWDTELATIDDKRLITIHHGAPMGMRQAINRAVAISTGEYICKLDAHCMTDDNFCKKLAVDCGDKEVIIPRRKRLDPINWCITEKHKPDVDYEYMCTPTNTADFGGKGLNGRIWNERSLERKNILIDENLSFQGSGWFIKRSYFDFLELMDEINYGPFWNEAQEIGLKAWLSGGRVLTNKKTWYAHLHKGKTHGRGYRMENSWLNMGSSYTLKWLEFGKAWHKQTIPIRELFERFAPVPTWHDPKTGKLFPELENIFK